MGGWGDGSEIDVNCAYLSCSFVSMDTELPGVLSPMQSRRHPIQKQLSPLLALLGASGLRKIRSHKKQEKVLPGSEDLKEILAWETCVPLLSSPQVCARAERCNLAGLTVDS